MDTKEYYTKLNFQKNNTFVETVENNILLGLSHDLIISLADWNKVITGHDPSNLLKNAIEQVDIACIHILEGMYRSGFAALRLSMEMVAGTVYFSSYNLEYEEWLKGGYDLNWSTIMNDENGILSRRFANAYFPECSDIIGRYLTRSKKMYRELSEMVHGNSSTWSFENPSIMHRPNLVTKFIEVLNEFIVVVNFELCVRFLDKLPPESIEIIETHVSDSLGTEEIIRTKIGGSV
ncbi:MAG: hypothetical protein ACJASQ_000724 [Crocinitomicaceae bacterium]|jgi:hypothetical protein